MENQSVCSAGSDMNYTKLIAGISSVPGKNINIFSLLDIQYTSAGAAYSELLQVTSLTEAS